MNKNELLKFSAGFDCVTTCQGCEGGLRDDAYNYVINKQEGRFSLESEYPYTAEDGVCNFDPSKAVGGIRGFFQPENESVLLQYVANHGPTSVGIDASGLFFIAYTSGVYDEIDDCNPYAIDHDVCIVDFGVENDLKYWIVRNSWGDEGYIKMARDVNMCGISLCAYLLRK